MALTRTALREKGITDKEILDFIMESHGDTVEAAKEKAKEDAEKAAQKKIDALQAKVDSLPEPDTSGKDWKAEYENLAASVTDKSGKTYKELHDALKGEFDTFRKTVETEKLTVAKRSALHSHLITDGASEKSAKLFGSQFDLATLELDGDKIKGWDELVKPIKEQYSEYFSTTKTVGAGVATPPKAESVKPTGNKDMNAFIRGVAE